MSVVLCLLSSRNLRHFPTSHCYRYHQQSIYLFVTWPYMTSSRSVCILVSERECSGRGAFAVMADPVCVCVCVCVCLCPCAAVSLALSASVCSHRYAMHLTCAAVFVRTYESIQHACGSDERSQERNWDDDLYFFAFYSDQNKLVPGYDVEAECVLLTW